jgi:cyclopropane fatty-acyl-phospholipid synthase-like methyltransferase
LFGWWVEWRVRVPRWPSQLESANFEIKSVDVLGVHYSATIHRWYLNWVSNKEKVIAKYGIRWYRVWVYFLAYSVMWVERERADCTNKKGWDTCWCA